MAATKLFVLRKGDKFMDWDGKSLTDRPSEALRVSETRGKRKYPGFEMLSFPEAYDQWFMAKNNSSQSGSGKE
jgi:hypothetical protein